MKKQFKTCVFVLFLCLSLSVNALALGVGDEVVPGGQVIALEMNTDGVIVSGLCEVAGCPSPAGEAGVRVGDRIVSLNGKAVRSGGEFISSVCGTKEDASLGIRRGEETLTLRVTPRIGEQGAPQLGLWVRDGVNGIGTVTFVDPESGAFGALGHGVELPESGALLPLKGGTVKNALVTAVIAGERGKPGELCGAPCAETCGTLEHNTVCGIFGHMEPPDGETVPIAPESEIRPGKCTILSTVDGAGARAFEAEITRITLSGTTRRLSVSVTDPALCAVTGGIVQGMSGSPILQNGKLIGAVTHVLVSDPTRGYGITIENMLESLR